MRARVYTCTRFYGPPSFVTRFHCVATMPSTGEAKRRQNFRRNAMRDAKRSLARAYRCAELPLIQLIADESLPIDLREEAMDLGDIIQQQIVILGEVRYIPKKAQATAALLNLVQQDPPSYAMQPLMQPLQAQVQSLQPLQPLQVQPQPLQVQPQPLQPLQAQSQLLQPQPLQVQPLQPQLLEPQPQSQPQPLQPPPQPLQPQLLQPQLFQLQPQLQAESSQPTTPSSSTQYTEVVVATPAVLDERSTETEQPLTPPASRLQPTPMAEQQPYSAADGVWLPCPANAAGITASITASVPPKEQPEELTLVPVFGSSGSFEGAAWGSTMLPVLEPQEVRAGAENAVCYGMCEVNGGTYYIMYG
jgi:hypothetical protein